MKMQISKVTESPALMILIANIAIIFLCLAGIPVIMGWMPTALSQFSDNTVLLERDMRSTNTVEHAAKKISAARTRVISIVPTPANSTKYVVSEPTQEIDFSGDDGVANSHDIVKFAPH